MASGFSNIIWKEDEKEEENCNFLLHQLVFFFFLDFSQRFLAKAVAQCLKIAQNVAFEVLNFGIFH